ncbi:MAG TPA: hypothetical protein VGQ99_18580 [Tepidisphaeraceae bacterium]|nr:hypothetical protein [Tepidisphaeraceae bacterium]
MATVLSLLMCGATVWLWVRSYQGPDYVEYGGKGRMFYKVISGHGTVDFVVILRWPQWEEFRVGRYDAYVYYGTRYSKRLLGFGTEAIWPEYGGRYVNVPHWFVVSSFGMMAVIFARKWWRGRRVESIGRCRVCGYDMRATPERCPECGSANEYIRTSGKSARPTGLV